MVDCPNEGFDTMYDEWLNSSQKMYNNVSKPLISNLGSGSDFTTFLQTYGISASSMTYVSLSVSAGADLGGPLLLF